MFDEIICALSGKAPDEEALFTSEDGIPDAWIRITLERRFPNPKWMAIQEVKQNLLDNTLAQLPKEEQENHSLAVSIQVEAQYAMLEDRTEPSLLENDVVYISPPEEDSEVMEAYLDLLDSLGIEVETGEEDEPPVSSHSPKPEEVPQEAQQVPAK